MSRTLRGRAAVALLALGALALGATSASAAPTIDPTADASLSIHKFEQPETATGLANDGTELDPALLAGLTPLEGVGFTIKQVPGIDLMTNAGWSDASAMTVATAAAAVAGVTGQTGLTDAAGLLSFDGLDLGLYYVEETTTPAGAKAAAPFLVTLPLTDPTTKAGWLYDVHVYPKNIITTAVKTVEDSEGATIGDTITWTITGEIPDGGPTDAYRVVDPLDSKLDYVRTVVSLTNGSVITEGVDYTVNHDTATNTVTVDFTPAGLAVLEANSTASVQVVIDTVVNAIGEIENVASIFPNQPSIDEGNPVVTPPVETRYGAVTAKKVNAAGDDLAGARFQVFTSLADANALTNPVVVGGVNSWTSGNDGLLTISGLHYSNYIDGVAVTDPTQWKHYYLVEVEAPAGYELLAAPVQFDVVSDGTALGLTIENTESNGGFELPLTGAQGVATLVAVGTLLIAGSVLLAVRSNRSARATR